MPSPSNEQRSLIPKPAENISGFFLFVLFQNIVQNFDRKEWLERTGHAQKYFSPIAAAISLFSCFTDGGLNVLSGGFIQNKWFLMVLSLLLTPVWNGLDILFAVLIHPDYLEKLKKTPTVTNQFRIFSNIFFNLFVLLPATVWATYTIITQEVEKKPLPSALSDFAFGGGAFLSALYNTMALSETPPPEEITKIRWAIASNLFCTAGAMAGGASMLEESKVPLYLSAGLYFFYVVCNFGPQMVERCCNAPAEAGEEEPPQISHDDNNLSAASLYAINP